MIRRAILFIAVWPMQGAFGESFQTTFEFHGGFRVNLYHTPLQPGGRDSVRPYSGPHGIEPREKTAWNEALDYYGRNPAGQDSPRLWKPFLQGNVRLTDAIDRVVAESN